MREQAVTAVIASLITLAACKLWPSTPRAQAQDFGTLATAGKQVEAMELPPRVIGISAATFNGYTGSEWRNTRVYRLWSDGQVEWVNQLWNDEFQGAWQVVPD
ncbi:MAG: hypothetical protein KDB18_04700 [Salinibacterium sp.]|nr:hypothetical protein [Salinibacterium sp.]